MMARHARVMPGHQVDNAVTVRGRKQTQCAAVCKLSDRLALQEGRCSFPVLERFGSLPKLTCGALGALRADFGTRACKELHQRVVHGRSKVRGRHNHTLPSG